MIRTKQDLLWLLHCNKKKKVDFFYKKHLVIFDALPFCIRQNFLLHPMELCRTSFHIWSEYLANKNFS